MRARTNGCAFSESDVGREVLILGAQSIAHPRTDGWEAGSTSAGHESELGSGVVDAIGRHRANERRLVDDLLKKGQEIGNLAPALAAFRERPRTRHDLL